MTQQIAVWLMNGTSAKTGGQGQAMQLQPGWGPSGTGDYDGNGKSDILLNHNGQVAVWLMNGVSVKTGGYGTAMQLQGNWYGVGSGDFDGDGKSDILLGKGYQDPTPK